MDIKKENKTKNHALGGKNIYYDISSTKVPLQKEKEKKKKIVCQHKESADE